MGASWCIRVYEVVWARRWASLVERSEEFLPPSAAKMFCLFRYIGDCRLAVARYAAAAHLRLFYIAHRHFTRRGARPPGTKPASAKRESPGESNWRKRRVNGGFSWGEEVRICRVGELVSASFCMWSCPMGKLQALSHTLLFRDLLS